MASIDPDLRRREAELARRERAVAAREAELCGRRSWSRAWWALRLLPGALVELAAALAFLVACILLDGAALATVAVLVALVMAAAGLTRLLDRTPPGG
jgi:hypothetical protein